MIVGDLSHCRNFKAGSLKWARSGREEQVQLVRNWVKVNHGERDWLYSICGEDKTSIDDLN